MEYWADLMGSIRQGADVDIAINGTGEEHEYFEPLLSLPGVISLFGSPLPTLIQALAQARCLVSVDTGTMHLSMALGTPVVALFGPTIPELTGPYSKNVPFSVLRSDIDCQPCLLTGEQKKCTFNRCMHELAPEKVYSSVERMMLVAS